MKSKELIKQWASYLTEGLKSYSEIMEDKSQMNTHKVKVEVSNIEWESYEGDDYDEDNEGGFPDCDCPTTVTLEIDVPDDADNAVLDGLIYNKLVDEIGDGWIPDYGNWNVEIVDPVQEDTGTISSGKPNIIFCDIDGIIVDIASKDSDFENAQLNQEQYHIDPSAVEVLKNVCSKTNSKIVIDSAWTWIKNGEKTKMVGTTHKLRSRIPEIKKALGEFLFDSEPLTPTLSKEEIPGNENVNFDETGFPISANRKLKDGTVKTIPFNLSIMKPFCIAKWLDSHKNEIEKYVIIDNNTKSLKWGASKTNYASEMTSALMDMNTSALVSTKGNAILDYFNVEKNDIEDTVDMEVSESDDINIKTSETQTSPYDEKINQCVQLAGELIDMSRKDPQTFKTIVKSTLEKIDIDPSILSVMNGVKSKMDLFKAAISVAKNGKIKDILKSLYR